MDQKLELNPEDINEMFPKLAKSKQPPTDQRNKIIVSFSFLLDSRIHSICSSSVFKRLESWLIITHFSWKFLEVTKSFSLSFWLFYPDKKVHADLHMTISQRSTWWIYRKRRELVICWQRYTKKMFPYLDFINHRIRFEESFMHEFAANLLQFLQTIMDSLPCK